MSATSSPAASGLFAPVNVEAVTRSDGARILRSREPLGTPSPTLGHDLERWAREAPERVFLAELVAGGAVRRVSYQQALAQVAALGQALLDRGLSATRPLVILSDNGVDHALLALAAMHVGVPAIPLSPAYSLQSQDLRKLRHLLSLVMPGAVFAADGELFARALGTEEAARAVRVVSRNPAGNTQLLEDWTATTPGEAYARARDGVTPDTVAKILFTSGSTGAPKGVLNTQRMLTSNQQAIAQVWPFLSRRPPVVVDWLPWSHTFGGNHNFNMVLRHGGTFFVDAGKPAPGLVEGTLASLRAQSPTLYFNVPRGFEVLLPALERDRSLCDALFAELDLLFYAAAALPASTWERLTRLIARSGRPVPLTSAWGSTETSPLVTSVHFSIERAGNIGVPVPGSELSLVPVGDRLELRVRGPQVTPGYFRDEAATQAAFDEHGFLRMGDAGRLAVPGDASGGVIFDGRLAENFKLTSGTWVSVGELRLSLVTACAPLITDVVIAGHDRDALGVLLFPNAAACAEVAGCAPGEIAAHPVVKAALHAHLRRHNAENPAASRRITRALLLASPPSIDAGEITDKGYVNQRGVLQRRAAEVARLFDDGSDEGLLHLDD